MSAAQMPPADELAAIRAQQKALEAREAELRAVILSDPSARTGNDFVADVREVEQPRTDLKALREMYPEQVAEHTYPSKVTRIVLSAVDQETGEIVSLRRAPKLHTIRVV